MAETKTKTAQKSNSNNTKKSGGNRSNSNKRPTEKQTQKKTEPKKTQQKANSGKTQQKNDNQPETKRSALPIVFIVAGALLVITIICDILARNVEGFGEFYADGIYPFFVHTIGFINGLFPFAVGEILILLLIIGAVVGFIVFIISMAQSENRKRLGAIALAVVMCTGVFLYSSYTFFCGINYHRVPFSQKSGLIPSKYSAEDLEKLCIYLIENANAAAEKISYDEKGLMSVETEGFDMKAECVTAMGRLSEKYSVLGGFYPAPKGVMASEFMSMCKILGIYDPFTIEANYNVNAPDFAIPFTLCHELSHLKGFMREDEANFIAYLACRESDNEYLNYSGFSEALIYAMGQYYSAAGAEKYTELYKTIHPAIIREMQNNNAYWKQYDTPVAKVSHKVNDTYLKVQGQNDGVKSYGRFVDLMLYDFLN